MVCRTSVSRRITVLNTENKLPLKWNHEVQFNLSEPAQHLNPSGILQNSVWYDIRSLGKQDQYGRMPLRYGID
jgi:hypothetical protein